MQAAWTSSTDKQHGYAAWTFSMYMQYEKQHGHAACRHEHAAWTGTCSMNTRTCSMDIHMQHGHEHATWPWACSTDMDMHHGHGHAAWTWKCRTVMDMQHSCESPHPSSPPPGPRHCPPPPPPLANHCRLHVDRLPTYCWIHIYTSVDWAIICNFFFLHFNRWINNVVKTTFSQQRSVDNTSESALPTIQFVGHET
jgi:hypothetical protein